MATVCTRWGKLTQTVPDHIFGDINRYMSASIMDGNCVPYHLGEDHTRATPSADYGFITALIHDFNFLE
jgi:hypothetical protein